MFPAFLLNTVIRSRNINAGACCYFLLKNRVKLIANASCEMALPCVLTPSTRYLRVLSGHANASFANAFNARGYNYIAQSGQMEAALIYSLQGVPEDADR